MEAWGVEVKAGQIVKVKPEKHKLIHISQATLGELKDKEGPKNVPLRLRFPNGCKFLIGSLTQEKPQIHLDLVFEKEFEFELSHGWKDGSVRFLGYITQDNEYSSNSSNTPSDVPMAGKQELQHMQISTRFQDGSTLHFRARSSTTIGRLKVKIEELKGIPMDQQMLMFDGRGWEDGKTLAECDIQNGDEIDCLLRLCGC